MYSKSSPTKVFKISSECLQKYSNTSTHIFYNYDNYKVRKISKFIIFEFEVMITNIMFTDYLLSFGHRLVKLTQLILLPCNKM